MILVTKEEELKQDTIQIDKKLLKLLNYRWQTVAITFGILSAFWGFLVKYIIESNDKGAIYLIFFIGCIFSGTLLFIWRYFSHQLADEEKAGLDSRFVFMKLLKDPNLNNFNDDDILKRVLKIRENELQIQLLIEYLYNEFDDPLTSCNELIKKILKLSSDNRKKLAIDLDIKHENFDRGQRRFDSIFGMIILIFLSLGLISFWLISGVTSDNQLFTLITGNYWWINPILCILWFGSFLKYIAHIDYLLRNSDPRRKSIEVKIDTLNAH